MANKETQTNQSTEFDKPINGGEKHLLDKIRDRVSIVRNRIAETLQPSTKNELEKETGEALAFAAEEVIDSADKDGRREAYETIDIIDVVGAAADQTIEGELAGQPDNPIQRLDNDGYGAELIEATVAIAETDLDMAEKIAAEIDRVEGFDESAEKGEDPEYKSKVERLKATSMTSAEAFVISGGFEGLSKSEKKKIFDNPENWDSLRRELHLSVFNDAAKEAASLSERLKNNNPKPTIYVLRGNTAAGKTRALKSSHEMFKGILDEHGHATGAINPDSYKYKLRQGHKDISAFQVHEEGSMIGRKVEKHLADKETSIVLDKRNETTEDIDAIMNNAAETERNVRMLDVDVPLEVSLVGVLMRERGGEDPNVPFSAAMEGFVGIRANRAALIDEINERSGTIVDGYLLMAFDPIEHCSVAVAQLGEDGTVQPIKGREDLYNSVRSENNEKVVTAQAMEVGDTIIDDAFIKSYCETYMDGSENGQRYANDVANKLNEFKGKTLRLAVDTLAGVSPKKEGEKYLVDANNNLLATSRTANGVVDTSASATKAESMISIDGNEAANKSKENFDKAIKNLFEQRDRDFSSADEVKKFVEDIAAQINDGIVKEDSLIRSGTDSDKYPYTRLENLPDAMQQFYVELQQRLSNVNSDPAETAAFCEYHIDLSDHFFADGCGKTAKAISSYVLMRAGLPLPSYKGGRSEYYKHAPTAIAGVNAEADETAWQDFKGYYKSMIGDNI
ncbi:MAG: zeta toxin family protein [Candidatus Saccharibacteria bacterium]